MQWNGWSRAIITGAASSTGGFSSYSGLEAHAASNAGGAAGRMATRVLVLDDSEAMLYSLHECIAAFPDLEWVGEAINIGEAFEKCALLRPDVLLIDVSLSHVDLPWITRQVRDAFPRIRVVATVGFEDRSVIEPILEAGAALCLPKGLNVLQFAEAIRTIGTDGASL